jgi:GH25 family lysozyme M1 (1,4-beta-N-acetylmuramidase)
MLSGYNVTYPVAVDVEWTNGDHDGRSDYLSVSERTAIVKAYCETIKARGYTPMIYASMNWLYYYLDMSQLTEYDVWLAHYTSDGLNTPSSYTGSYTTWQYSSKGILPGINGYVDVNICYKQY